MREIVEAQKQRMMQQMDEANKKKASAKKDTPAKKDAPSGGIKVNKEVIPRVGNYLSEHFWQDLSYNLGVKLGDHDKAKQLVNKNKDKIEEVISKMAGNTNISISPKL